MKIHLTRGLMTGLTTFILLMVWAAVASFFDHRTYDYSPINFTLQKHGLVVWILVSLVVSFIMIVITTSCSLLLTLISSHRFTVRSIWK